MAATPSKLLRALADYYQGGVKLYAAGNIYPESDELLLMKARGEAEILKAQPETKAAKLAREAAERAEREAADRAAREAKEAVAREAAEQAARDAETAAAREAAEKAEREAHEAAEREAAEKAEQEAKDAAEKARLLAEQGGPSGAPTDQQPSA